MVKSFENSLIQEYHIDFNLTIWNDDKIVWLNRFIIPKKHRRHNVGTRLLNDFTQWLDANHFTSYLLVANCYGTDEQILFDFYKKFGYNITDEFGKNKLYMKRIGK